ncbi:hypothetical protein [Pseudonocardia xishanensis]|uniref:DUF3618 domain-containing protein n=1 Tax=Pseudonocardia xishanensis TaxID=630995 RepID=A0ABP8RQ66_9PSEU
MSTTSALTRARDHAGAALSSLGEAAEELAHEAKDLLDRELPVIAEKAAGTAGALAGRAEVVAGELASRAGSTAGELASRAEDLHVADRITEVRRELAARIDPDGPSTRRWWWIGAGVLVTIASVVGWLVLSRRPQEVPVAEPPATTPPGVVDLEAETPEHAARNGHS